MSRFSAFLNTLLSGPVKAIDLYSENPFDPAQLVADGYSGVFFKGGQGSWPDVPRVHPEWPALAKSHGLKVGWFWVVDSRYIPEVQKAAIKATFPTADFGELGLWLDCEKPRIDMTDADYHRTACPGYKTIESVARGVEAYSGKLPRGIYTGPGAFALIFTWYGCPKATLDWFAQMLLWTAQYPWVYVPGVSKPTLYGSWTKWAFWQWREGPDVDLFGGSAADFAALFGGSVTPPEPQPEPDAYTVKRALSDVELCFTSGTRELPLLSAVEAATANGWAAALNGGAGFDYTDTTHAIPKSIGFQTVSGIPYARRAIENGTVNPALADNPNRGPWSILGFDGTNVYLTVTRGLEPNGMTQTEAARYVQSLGCFNAYLMDSGHSCQLEEGGVMKYWPYAPDEKVPQHIGLKIKTSGGNNVTTYKGIGKVLSSSNIKTLAGIQTGLALTGGDYVFGEPNATNPPTDLMNFDHFYRANGARVDIGKGLCKVTTLNMLTPILQAVEPGPVTPPPPVDPPPATVPGSYHVEMTDTATGARYAGDLVKQA